ncbi:hypothetical protein VNO77_16015 [Canavalia gladiata]|uniref:Uncharacterized protein n=1 Tax=Canavalia gladiata TaxID=3824 RepID=A0AAN9QSR4_CANGL
MTHQLGCSKKIAKRKSDSHLYADVKGEGFVEVDYTLKSNRLPLSTGNSVGNVSEYSGRQKVDAQWHLLDLELEQALGEVEFKEGIP